MYSLFLISETNNGSQVDRLDIDFNYLKDARAELFRQINILSSKSDANETQPTMNFKDRFNFWIDGEKRHFVISKYYRSNKRAIRMELEALDKLNDFKLIK